jgi:hypothetical protein
MGQKPYVKEQDEVLQSPLSGSGRYVRHGAVAGASNPQPSDLTSKKISPGGSLLYLGNANYFMLPLVTLPTASRAAPAMIAKLSAAFQ